MTKERINPKGLYSSAGAGVSAVESCGCAVQAEETCGCCYEHDIVCGQCWLEERAAAEFEDHLRFGGSEGAITPAEAEAVMADGPWGVGEVDEDVFLTGGCSVRGMK